MDVVPWSFLGKSDLKSKATIFFEGTSLNVLTKPRDDILEWDLPEIANGRPFDELLDVDTFVNCIYLNLQIPHFITHETIAKASKTRRL